MRKTTTVCKIKNSGDSFAVSFPEFPDIPEITIDSLEDAIDLAPVYLATHMLDLGEEFPVHTSSFKDMIEEEDESYISIINCSLDDMEYILTEYKTSPKELLNWVKETYGGVEPSNETAPVKVEADDEDISFDIPEPPAPEEPPIPETEFEAEFETEFKPAPSPEPIPETPDKEEHTSGLKDKLDTINTEKEKAKDVFISLEEDDDGLSFAPKTPKHNSENSNKNNKNGKSSVQRQNNRQRNKNYKNNKNNNKK